MTAVLRLSLPLTLWLAGFSAIYGLQGLTCATGRDALSHRMGLTSGQALLTMAALGVVLLQVCVLWALASHRFGGPPGFAHRVAVALATAALAATLWTAAPITALPACDGPATPVSSPDPGSAG